MKTITKTIELYNYDELEGQAKEKAREKIKDRIVENNFDCLKEELKEELQYKYNLKNCELHYLLSYSQGDYVEFTKYSILDKNIIINKDVEKANPFEKYLIENCDENELKMIIEYLDCGYNINALKQPYCNIYKYIDYDYYYLNKSDDNYNELENKETKVNDYIVELCKKLNSIYSDICHELAKIGYACYDVSDDETKEYCDDNEYLFYKNGDIYYE